MEKEINFHCKNMNKQKIFVLGDSHGGYKAFLQVMERSGFDYKKDHLISLGDLADGWTETPELIEELLKVKNLIVTIGNHDFWVLNWLKDEKNKPDIWTMQGGYNTQIGYERRPDLKKKHLKFLKSLPYYYIDEKNRLFVHGGFKPGEHPKDTDKEYLMWDRQLWENRYNSKPKREAMMQFEEVYVGHTSIYRFSHKPIKYGNVWFMDTGGGFEGKLSIMDVDTKEVFQSDMVKDLYPEVRW